MLRLRTFGAALVERDGEVLRGAAAQRRVIALLAVLAVARDQGASRDRLVGLLWPDSEPEKARQALTQALYHTRRVLGEDDLFLSGADLRLNAAVIASDVAEFEGALDRDDLERRRIAVRRSIPRRVLRHGYTRVRALDFTGAAATLRSMRAGAGAAGVRGGEGRGLSARRRLAKATRRPRSAQLSHRDGSHDCNGRGGSLLVGGRLGSVR